jgi:hypothetical protein
MGSVPDIFSDIETEATEKGESSGEKWGWGLLRPPPMPAVFFGALYGLIAGMVIVYDVVVIFRMGKVLLPKLKERTPIIGKRG